MHQKSKSFFRSKEEEGYNSLSIHEHQQFNFLDENVNDTSFSPIKKHSSSSNLQKNIAPFREINRQFNSTSHPNYFQNNQEESTQYKYYPQKDIPSNSFSKFKGQVQNDDDELSHSNIAKHNEIRSTKLHDSNKRHRNCENNSVEIDEMIGQLTSMREKYRKMEQENCKIKNRLEQFEERQRLNNSMIRQLQAEKEELQMELSEKNHYSNNRSRNGDWEESRSYRESQVSGHSNKFYMEELERSNDILKKENKRYQQIIMKKLHHSINY